MDNTVGSLTPLMKSVIIGSLLGDGHLRIVKGRKNAFLEVHHSWKQKKYIEWKFKILKNICKRGIKRSKDGKRYKFFTCQHKWLTVLYFKFYRKGKKQVNKEILLKNLDELGLAVWYMDDGSKCRDTDIYLNTQYFSLKDQLKLLEVLRKKFKIEARVNKDKHYFRIRILKRSVPVFFKLIRKWIIPSMRYKVPKIFERSQTP